MANRKTLLKNSIVKKDKASTLRGVRFLGFNGFDTFSFSINSATRRGVFHRIKIQIVDLFSNIENFLSINDFNNFNKIKSVINFSLTNKVRVFCSCEDFLYSGSKYWNYRNDSGIEAELRPPSPDKLRRRSLLCKHIRFILSNISRYLYVMAKAVSRSLLEMTQN